MWTFEKKLLVSETNRSIPKFGIDQTLKERKEASLRFITFSLLAKSEGDISSTVHTGIFRVKSKYRNNWLLAIIHFRMTHLLFFRTINV